MALLELPYPEFTFEQQASPTTHHRITARVVKLRMTERPAPEDDGSPDWRFSSRRRHLDVEVIFAEPLSIGALLGMPEGYVYDREKLSLTRTADLRNCYRGAEWGDMTVHLTWNNVTDDPELEWDCPGSDTGKPHRYRPVDVFSTNYDGDVLYTLGSCFPEGVVPPTRTAQSWVSDWTCLPLDRSHLGLVGWDKQSEKANRTTSLVRALFPSWSTPAPDKTASGRRITFGTEGPWFLPEALMPRQDIHMPPFRQAEIPPLLMLGIGRNRDDFVRFRAPAFMDEAIFSDRSREPGALPVSRVLIYRSPLAFHFLFVLAAVGDLSGGKRGPALVCIPVVVDARETVPVRVNFRNLDPDTNAAINEVPGLPNAMRRALNGLKGELFSARYDLDQLTASSVRFAPKHHVTVTLNSYDGNRLVAWRWGASNMPTLATVLLDIGRYIGHATDRTWGAPLLQPATPVATVAPREERRALDL